MKAAGQEDHHPSPERLEAREADKRAVEIQHAQEDFRIYLKELGQVAIRRGVDPLPALDHAKPDVAEAQQEARLALLARGLGAAETSAGVQAAGEGHTTTRSIMLHSLDGGRVRSS